MLKEDLVQRAEIVLKFDRHDILPTPQRLEIAEILLDKPRHMSAEQIIAQLRAKGSGVSKATVYNTLNLFSERGLIQECVVDPERRFYDSNNERHHHFYNIDTGELTDISPEEIKFADMPDFPSGGQLDSVEVLIKLRNNPSEKLS